MHLHILGICGTFMGGLALLARAAGHRVTGCDANVYPPMSEQLANAGIELIEGFDAAQLKLAPDLFVIGNAMTRGNPLIEAILDAGASFTSGPQWIGEQLLKDRPVIAVAGTHGKTTTASMVAWVLECAGRSPGFLIGGVPLDFGISARSGGSAQAGKVHDVVAFDQAAISPGEAAPFVIEADEYDTAFFDKRSKFVHYFPRIAVLNNLEFDHADIFTDLAAIEAQFHHLVRTISRRGRLIVNGQSPALDRVLSRGVWSPVDRFDDTDQWHASAVAQGDIHQFDVHQGNQHLGRLDLPLTGAHNRSNALAAVAATVAAGVSPKVAMDALASFKGVKRRMEMRGHFAGVTVYDDFAHHPTAIHATLLGLRRKVGQARVLAILEPRSNTMKLGAVKAQLAPSLVSADLVFAYSPQSGVAALGWDLAAALSPLGARAATFDAIDELVKAVVNAARPGDYVLVMSNGSFGNVHQKLLRALGSR